MRNGSVFRYRCGCFAVALGLWILLEKTPLGKAIYLIGSNERATLYSGINTRRVLIWVYVISALLYCGSGIFDDVETQLG